MPNTGFYEQVDILKEVRIVKHHDPESVIDYEKEYMKKDIYAQFDKLDTENLVMSKVHFYQYPNQQTVVPNIELQAFSWVYKLRSDSSDS